MGLHNDIMNLQTPKGIENLPTNVRLVYKYGHRDARHAAAELTIAHEKRMGELERLLEWSLDFIAKNPPKTCPVGEDFKNLKNANDILDGTGEYK